MAAQTPWKTWAPPPGTVPWCSWVGGIFSETLVGCSPSAGFLIIPNHWEV